MDKQRLQDLIGADYTLQWVIGHGGMSTVWLADDTRQQREVAIKVLRPEFSDNDEFLDRFYNEAQTAQLIHSPHVVETYDYRELEDSNGAKFCFMALEFIRGESLADLIAREKMIPEERVLNVLEQAAQGLADIHAMNMIHRDIKPGNLLISENGQVKITDFGIAKAAAAVPLTRTGMVVGTAQYVSPEQAQGLEVTSASDIYSLGVVGYEMLTGRRPFVGDSSVSVALAHINQAPEPLPTTITAPTRELISVCLRKDPATRYPDGSLLSQAVSDVRLGKRPPYPAGAPVHEAPPEYVPDAATSTIHAPAPSAPAENMVPAPSAPAEGMAPVPSAPAENAASAVESKKAGKSKFLAVTMAVIVVAASAGAWFAWQSKTHSTPPQKDKEVVIHTQWVEPSTQVAEQPTDEETSTSPLTVKETTEVPVTVTETMTAPPPPPPNFDPDPAPPPLPRTNTPRPPKPETPKSLESLVNSLIPETNNPSPTAP